MTMSITEANTPAAEREAHYAGAGALADLPYLAARARSALVRMLESGVLSEGDTDDVQSLLDCVELLPGRFS